MSGIGKQLESTKRTAPAFGFGAEPVIKDRQSTRSEFLGLYGKQASPGPVPAFQAPKTDSSKKVRGACVTVSRSVRACNLKTQPSRLGPGSFKQPDGFGKQLDSRKRTTPSFTF